MDTWAAGMRDCSRPGGLCMIYGERWINARETELGFVGMHELPHVTHGLVERGHADEVIRKVLGENYLRVFEQVWR